jgi:predicted DsbA family dithiol-disulfide isomerase
MLTRRRLRHAPRPRLRDSDRALASLPPPAAAAVSLRWKPYLLAPPESWTSWGEAALREGVDKKAYYDKRFGKDAWKARTQPCRAREKAHARALARTLLMTTAQPTRATSYPEMLWQAFLPRLESAMHAAGIEGFTMDGRTGPSVDSHRLLGWAGDTRGARAQHALAEALFAAYFTRGEPLCDTAVLLRAVQQAGLPADEAQAFLADPAAGAQELAEELRLGRSLGVSGVPYFRISDGTRAVAVSGAQPPEALAEAIRSLLPPAAQQGGGGGAACDARGCPA